LNAAAAFDAACGTAAQDIAEAPGKGRNLVDIAQDLTGIDIVSQVNASMIRHLSAFTDEGLASLRMPERHKGLFTAWRKAAPADPLLRFEGGGTWHEDLAALPDNAPDALIGLLDAMGIPEDHWEAYLARSLAQLRGWGGMMFWLETHPGHYKQKVQPADTVQYLAMRLFTEKAVLDRILEEVCGVPARLPDLVDWANRNAPEVLLRQALHGGTLSPELTDDASLILSMRPPTTAERVRIAELARRHWQGHTAEAAREAAAQDVSRVNRVAVHLGLTGADIAAAPGLARALLTEINALEARTISRLWLEAYEAHYRDEVLNALSLNKDRGRWIKGRSRRPRAQLVLCIDEREENIHRYFGELDPDFETLGAAGFFGVAIAHSGLGDHAITPLCPAVATPGHRTAEVPRDAALDTVWPVAQRRAGFAEAFDAVMWETKRNPVVAFLTTQVTGLFHAVPLIGRIFAPLGFHRLAETAVARVMPKVPTRLTHARIEGDALARYGLHGQVLINTCLCRRQTGLIRTPLQHREF
jgi:uncharacterized protein YbcC (UPF0753/DUF2309 family)